MKPFKTFMGSRVFINAHTRRALPHLTPDFPAPVWKIIKGLIGQDLTKVSMPCIMNEALGALQRFAEIFINGAPLFAKAAECDDPFKRMLYVWVGQAVCLNSVKRRIKKPFNSMLGETYEYVAENFRVVTEKIQHTPD